MEPHKRQLYFSKREEILLSFRFDFFDLYCGYDILTRCGCVVFSLICRSIQRACVSFSYSCNVLTLF